ncbi:MAG: substrate-binding periplasmic protein [Roseateles sp.]
MQQQLPKVALPCGEGRRVTGSAARWAGPVAGVLAWALAVLPVGACWGADEKLHVVTEEWAPYNYAEGGVLKGLSVEVVQALARALQVEIDVQLLPSMRATVALDNQPRTLMVSMLRTPEREARYKWIGPLGDSSIYFYKRKGSPLAIDSFEDARKVPLICARHAGLTVSRLRDAGFTNLDASAPDGRAVYRMLLFGRCDLAVSDSPLGVAHALKQMGYAPDAVVQTPLKLLSLPLFIAGSKDIPDAEIARWQAALDAMKRSGAFQAILKKYGE